MNNTKTPLVWIIRQLLRLVLRANKSAKAAVKSNTTVANLLYDFSNVEEFSDLSSHERMLADSVRVDTYAEGIRRHIKPGDVVVDLGTGTGILAILAARQGAKVYAIDHSNFISVAAQVAKDNGVDTINFIHVHSKDFVCPEQVDILLHEQMADCLFDENMVENLIDFKQRCLKDTGKVLPGRFELFLEPIALKASARIPFIWELCVQDINYEVMRNLPELEAYKKKTYGFSYIERSSFDFFLSTPQPIIQIDLNRMTSAEEIPTHFKVTRKVVRPGKMAGLCVFFRVLFDDETQFSTRPDQPRTHWGTRVFRTLENEYAADDTVAYTLTMGSIKDPKTWSASVLEA